MSAQKHSESRKASTEMTALRTVDPEIHELIRLETKRQDEFVRLIPSENYARRGDGSDGVDPEQQILGRVPGTPLLRIAPTNEWSRSATRSGRCNPDSP